MSIAKILNTKCFTKGDFIIQGKLSKEDEDVVAYVESTESQL